MTYQELLEKVKELKFEEVRTDLPTLFEAVTQKDSLKKLTPILESCFGPPFKPAGQAPSSRVQEYTAGYGGIRKEQTLYRSEVGSIHTQAMLWPWSDGMHVTLKILIKDHP